MGCVSCWIRYTSTLPAHGGATRFAIVLFGQCIGALAQPIYTNAPAKLAGSWFPVKEREIATTIAAILNPVGNALGSVVPGIMVQRPDQMGTMLLGEACLATLTFLPVACLFKSECVVHGGCCAVLGGTLYVCVCGCVWVGGWVGGWVGFGGSHHMRVCRPPTPPSASASRRHILRSQSLKSRGNAETMSSSSKIWHEVCMLLSDRNFCLLLCGFGMGLGLFNAIITTIAQLIQPCGYSSTQAGYLSGLIIGCGLFGAAVAGPVRCCDTHTHARARLAMCGGCFERRTLRSVTR